jgi:nicotinate-nucleotide adenylyltransferase
MNPPDSLDGTRKGGSRVAFFGGSFDPPHLGHLAVARAACDAFRLNTVLFAPVGVQPLKPEGSTASFEQRVAMTRLAIAGQVGFRVSLADAPKSTGAPNYTLETLKELRAGLGADSVLYCLMGADSFFGLKRWHRAAEIPFVAPLIVASRPGEPLSGLDDALPEGLTIEAGTEADLVEADVEVQVFSLVNRVGDRAPFYVLPGLHEEISASEIREGLRRRLPGQAGRAHSGEDGGKAVLPDAVREYVQAHGLYR